MPNRKCECEHISHFRSEQNPVLDVHEYGEVIGAATGDEHDGGSSIFTDFGRFWICAACESTHFSQNSAGRFVRK